MTVDPPDPDSATRSADGLFLLRYLQEHHAPCPRCGYDLHRLVSPRCSECGEPLSLQIALAQPHLRHWLAAAIPLFAAAGAGLFMLLLMLMFRLPSETRYPLFRWSAGYFWLCMPLAPLIILARRMYMRWPRRLQAWLAAAAWTCLILGLWMACARV